MFEERSSVHICNPIPKRPPQASQSEDPLATYTEYPYTEYLKVIATPRYEKDAKRLLKEEEKAAMELSIMTDPEAHPVVPGLSGVRKARWSRQGKGKSGGVRAIYYYSVAPSVMYLIYIYAKNEQANLNQDQRKQVKKVVEVIKRGKKENQ